ncbi:HRDC domain-containing protein [Lewinella sp. IMCC34183]|uniref:HRDC domain-containing protein n=1 Tax=Lewinella sp. IMCC34183 TaxID=2248762 RepID=UPI000E229D63|nr:HRDC domain-containing protein [Lewinella sp. IMCC34183]
MSTNPELDLAYRFIRETDRHIFLTGKAGTGKTTFLHRVREEVVKRKVVVAPTGVAAINAKGVTIHSQFQLPFGVLAPDRLTAELRKHRLSNKKVEVLRSLDLLIIDEISMVRADVLDAMGAVLRKYRGNDRPFGGVQVLMIGDLHQLPPVVRDADWDQLRLHYATPYFFGSRELKEAGVRTVQLRHIYRQSDADFIELLNAVRHDRLGPEGLARLNSRYLGPDFTPPAGDDYITLTSHNRTADAINEQQLATLSTPAFTFEARVGGNFPESMYPNDPKLTFRVGAQVMFNKNDTAEHRYYNGKIGRITAIAGDRITVDCPDDEEPIQVTPVEWENRKYELTKNKEVTDEVIGTFEQHPLRLAWAITIHKSQGLTFERVIIDAAKAFAHGQVYVALSRCKTFEGIVLRSRIGDESVRTDRVVSDYSTRAEREAPTDADLREDRRIYQLNCLQDLFDFEPVGRSLARLERSLFEHEKAVQGEALEEVREIRPRLEEIAKVCRGFSLQLNGYARADELPAEHAELTGRLEKARAYLLPRLRELYGELGQLSFMSDNQKVYETVSERLKQAGLSLLLKLRGLESLEGGLDPDRYVRARADATLEFAKQDRTATPRRSVPKTTRHPLLYERLTEWRTAQAAATDIPPYRILHNSVLLGIADTLPGDRDALLSISGVGKRSFERYGADLLALVEAYAGEHDLDLSAGQLELPDPTPAKPASPTRAVTLAAFRGGKSVAEIAADRGFTEGTINGHLLYWIREGELRAEDVLPPERLTALTTYLSTYSGEGWKPVFDHFGGTYSYDEIRMAGAALDSGVKAEE